MRKEVLKEPIFAKEIAEIIKVSPSIEEMREQLRDYHENDIAQSFEVRDQLLCLPEPFTPANGFS